MKNPDRPEQLEQIFDIQNSRFFLLVTELLDSLDEKILKEIANPDLYTIIELFVLRLACQQFDLISEEHGILIAKLLVYSYGKEVSDRFASVRDELRSFPNLNWAIHFGILEFFEELKKVSSEDFDITDLVGSLKLANKENFEDAGAEEFCYVFSSELVEGELRSRIKYDPDVHDENDDEEWIEIPEQLVLPFWKIRNGVREPLLKIIFVRNPDFVSWSEEDDW
jgi:hypothetical protein